MFVTKYLAQAHNHINVTQKLKTMQLCFITKKQLVKRSGHQFVKQNNLCIHDVRTRRIKTTPKLFLM
jgi:hypothetical protein